MTTPTDTSAALQEIERLAQHARTLYAPSVLQEAATLLADMLATGERHGVTREDWADVTSLPNACLDAVSRRYRNAPKPARTPAEIGTLHRALIAALAELGLTDVSAGRTVIVDRPRGSLPLGVGIWTDGGWDLSLVGMGSSPVEFISAPATEAGAAEVAAIVADVVHGNRSDPFRRS